MAYKKLEKVYKSIYDLDAVQVLKKVTYKSEKEIKKGLKEGNLILFSPEDWADELKGFISDKDDAKAYNIDISKDYLEQVIKFCDEVNNDGWNFYNTYWDSENDIYYRYVLSTAV